MGFLTAFPYSHNTRFSRDPVLQAFLTDISVRLPILVAPGDPTFAALTNNRGNFGSLYFQYPFQFAAASYLYDVMA